MAQGIAAKIGTSASLLTPHAWAPAALACMGVVFGDIGTSPLYTLSVAAKVASPGGTVAPDAVLGIVSLIFWSLIVVISIKYATLIMRALALLAGFHALDQIFLHRGQRVAFDDRFAVCGGDGLLVVEQAVRSGKSPGFAPRKILST